MAVQYLSLASAPHHNPRTFEDRPCSATKKKTLVRQLCKRSKQKQRECEEEAQQERGTCPRVTAGLRAPLSRQPVESKLILNLLSSRRDLHLTICAHRTNRRTSPSSIRQALRTQKSPTPRSDTPMPKVPRTPAGFPFQPTYCGKGSKRGSDRRSP